MESNDLDDEILFDGAHGPKSVTSDRKNGGQFLFSFTLPPGQVYIGSAHFSAATLEVLTYGLRFTLLRRADNLDGQSYHAYIPFTDILELSFSSGMKGILLKPNAATVKLVRQALVVRQVEFDADRLYNSVLVLLPPAESNDSNNNMTPETGLSVMRLAYTADTGRQLQEVDKHVAQKILRDICESKLDLPPNMFIDEFGNYCEFKQEIKVEPLDTPRERTSTETGDSLKMSLSEPDETSQPSCKKVKVKIEPEY